MDQKRKQILKEARTLQIWNVRFARFFFREIDSQSQGAGIKQKIKNNRLLADLITERNVNSLIDDNDLKSKCKDVKKLQDSNYI